MNPNRLSAHRQGRRTHQRGLTLIDCMIVLTIIGILVGQAAPSWMQAFADKKLLGEAESVVTALQLARTQAVARNEGVWFSVTTTPRGATCHVLHAGNAADCTCTDSGAAVCSAPDTTVIAAGVHTSSVRASLAHSIRFEPRNGTATPTGTVVLRSDSGKEVQGRVAITGRVRMCAAGEGMPGLVACDR